MKTNGQRHSLDRLRVTKKFGPRQDGAKRLFLRYGEQLVCVRHRLSDDGTHRHTTVELVVETTPVVPRRRATIAVRIPTDEKHTRALLIACGAQWQPKQKYWLIPHLIARNLRVLRYRVPISG